MSNATALPGPRAALPSLAAEKRDTWYPTTRHGFRPCAMPARKAPGPDPSHPALTNQTKAQGLGDVRRGHLRAFPQIGNRTRHPHYPVIPARR